MEPPSSPSVQAEESGNLVKSWFFTILYCGFCFPFFLLSLFVIRDFMFIMISGFFALWGVVYLVLTLRMTLGIAKFGSLRILIEKPPPAPGGRLTAAIFLPKGAEKLQSVKAVLSCNRVSAASQLREPLLAVTRSFPVRPNVRGGVARIAIDIPAMAMPSALPPARITQNDEKDYIRWNLHVTADSLGLDLEGHFPILVQAAQPGVAAARVEVPAVRAEESATTTETEVETETDSSSTWLLVAVNLVPIVGAVFWQWQVRDIVFLYWIENLVIGAFNILRIFFAEPDLSKLEARGIQSSAGEMLAGKAAVAGFFLIHYGGFCYGHGEFLTSFFHSPGQSGASIGSLVAGLLGEHGAKLALLAIVASHAYSFFRNYLGRGEYRGVNVAEMMFRPYKRIFVTHIFIIFGGFLLMAVKNPVLPMIIFVALKIGFDVYFHRKERAPKGTA